MPLCEMLSHRLLVSIAWRFTLNLFPYASDNSCNTHTHTHTHTLRHNLILLYCPHPHLLSQGRRRKTFMQSRPSALIWKYYTDKCIRTYVHIYTHTHTRVHTCTSSVSPIVFQMKTCQLLQQFYRRLHCYHRMQILNLSEMNAFPSENDLLVTSPCICHTRALVPQSDTLKHTSTSAMTN